MPTRAALAALASTLLINTAWAESEGGDWIDIASSTTTQWQAKKASGHITTVDGKKNTGYVYVYQVLNKQTNLYEYDQLVVMLDACKKGYGHAIYNDMQGKYTGKDAFVRFGPTIADALGSMACTSWDSDTGKVSRKDNGNEWEHTTEAKQYGDKYALNTDMVRKRSYKNKPSITALFRDHDVRADKSTYSEYVIATSDCSRGFGMIYELDFDGSLRSKTDVALNGNSVISHIASKLCSKR